MVRVFISYSSKDSKYADYVCRYLEANGISCWIAPRDIVGGKDYASVIPKAIRDCDYFLLLLSDASMSSGWVAKELDRAINANKRILPFELHQLTLKDNFEFYLTNVQRYSGYRDYQRELNRLIEDIVSGDAGTVYGGHTSLLPAELPKAPAVSQAAAKTPKNHKKLLLAVAAAVCIALIIGAVLLIKALKQNNEGKTDAGKTAEAAEDPNRIVSFSDPVFEKAFREKSGLSGDITVGDLDSFTVLDLSECELTDISDIAMFRKLERLKLSCNQIVSLNPLRSLTSLKKLGLDGNRITNLEPLEALTDLITLDLSQNSSLSDIGPLAKLQNLENLNLNDTYVSDISALRKLSNLKLLWMTNCQLTDISGLAGLSSIEELDISDNPNIADFSSLSQLTALTRLCLENTGISDLSVLSPLTVLVTLNVPNNAALTDLSPLIGHDALVNLSFNYTGVTDISPLAQLKSLKIVYLSGNPGITDFRPLAGLPNLKTLQAANMGLSRSQISELKKMLPNCEIITG